MMSFGSSSVWMCKSILIQSSFSVISIMRDQFIADEQISYFVLITVIVLVIDSVPITSRSRSKRVNRQSACEPCSSIYRSQSLSTGSQRLLLKKLGWWNGRHVRLRGVCRKACGFKSRPEHHSIDSLIC